ncbi:hypothetical protein EDD17DRAFT_1679533, partial [Pisolithus thermaeus]
MTIFFIECFYYKEEKWYHAGTYVSGVSHGRSDDSRVGIALDQTTQALIKKPLAGGKSVSPQNTYETGQLYAVGAL